MSGNVNNNTFLIYTLGQQPKTTQGASYNQQDVDFDASLFATNPFLKIEQSTSTDPSAEDQTQEQVTNTINIYVGAYDATLESMTDEEGGREIGAITDEGSSSYFTDVEETPETQGTPETSETQNDTPVDPTYQKYLDMMQNGISDANKIGAKEAREAEEAKKAQEAQEAQGTQEAQETQETQETEGADEVDGAEEVENEEENTGVNPETTEESDDKVDSTQKNESGITEEEYQDKYGIRDGFDPRAVATSVHDAMKGFGTDEDTVLKYLGTKGGDALNDAELRAVLEAYEDKYGEPMEEYIKHDFSGSDEDQLIARINNAREGLAEKYAKMSDSDKQEVVHQLAEKLYEAMWHAGTDEEALLEVLTLDPTLRKDVLEYYDNSPYADKKSFKDKADRELSWGYQDKLDELYGEVMN